MGLTKKIAAFIGRKISSHTLKHKDKLKKDFSEKDIEEVIILGCHMFLKVSIWLISLFVVTKFVFYKVFKGAIINSNQIDFHLALVYIYVFIYWLFRRKFGGAHFQNDLLCTIFSIVLPIIFSYLSLIVNINLIYIITAYIFSYFTALHKGVIDSTKKPLKSLHKAKLKREGLFQLTYVLIVNVLIYLAYKHAFENISILKNISNIITLSSFTFFINIYFGKPSIH